MSSCPTNNRRNRHRTLLCFMRHVFLAVGSSVVMCGKKLSRTKFSEFLWKALDARFQQRYTQVLVARQARRCASCLGCSSSSVTFGPVGVGNHEHEVLSEVASDAGHFVWMPVPSELVPQSQSMFFTDHRISFRSNVFRCRDNKHLTYREDSHLRHFPLRTLSMVLWCTVCFSLCRCTIFDRKHVPPPSTSAHHFSLGLYRTLHLICGYANTR